MEDEIYDQTSVAPRACDRCHALKTQCQYGNPCGRCQRLGLDCTNVRPQRTRGRPPKAPTQSSQLQTTDPQPLLQTTHSAARSSTSSPGLLDLSVFEDLPELSVQHDLAAEYLRTFLSCVPDQGFYSIIPTRALSIMTGDTPTDEFLEHIRRTEVCSTLLAISLGVYAHRLPSHMQRNFESSRDTLIKTALALMPDLTWQGNRLHSWSAFCLLLLSYTWCISDIFSRDSIRWCSLARILLNDSHLNASDLTPSARELRYRMNVGLTLHEQILSLILNNQTPHAGIGEAHLTAPIHALDDVQHLYEAGGQNLEEPHSFFCLYQHFIIIISAITKAPVMGSPAWIESRTQLEDYFFQFPDELLDMKEVQRVYQLEAMIWMHGLFVILYSTRDILDLIQMEVYCDISRFPHIVEHSFLLGEILYFLLAIDPTMEYCSPATIYFISLSSAVHTLVLRQFLSHPNARPCPQKVIVSSGIHISVLEALELSCKRCDLEIIREIRTLLSTCLTKLTQGGSHNLSISCEVLHRYRWCLGGSGMIKMSDQDARWQWNYPGSPNEDIRLECSATENDLTGVICTLCDPDQRVCQDGFFDLSIVIPV